MSWRSPCTVPIATRPVGGRAPRRRAAAAAVPAPPFMARADSSSSGTKYSSPRTACRLRPSPGPSCPAISAMGSISSSMACAVTADRRLRIAVEHRLVQFVRSAMGPLTSAR